jgi:hypothetical protein
MKSNIHLTGVELGPNVPHRLPKSTQKVGAHPLTLK